MLASAHVDTFTRDNLPDPATWPELLFTLPELAYPPLLNCAVELLDRVAERRGAGQRCLVTATETWTYGDLVMRSNQVARVLVQELGLVPGNRVLLRGPNNPWLVACWFGVVKAGGVAVATMPLLRPAELRAIAEIGQVRLALCDARFAADLEAAGMPGLQTLRYGDDGPDDLVQLCAAAPAAGFEPVATSADDVCLLAFTSGTTGRPKATMHFHRDVLAIADTFSRHVLRPRPEDLFAGSPPIAFTFGLGGQVVFPLHAGAATLLLERAGPEQLLDAVGRHRVSVLFTAPTGYRAMAGAARGADLGSLRRCVSAGETLPAATWRAFHEATGLRIIDGLGSTEMLHIFVSSSDDEIRPGFTGRIVPGYVAEVQDEAGGPLPAGEPGLLAVRGPTGCRYLRGDRQGAYVRRGWNVTGDVYVCDREGYFQYQARADDMIISAGYNIAGPEVEEALLRHPDVAETAVVGVPNAERGTIVKAFVVLRAGVAGTTEMVAELQDFVRREIAPYKYPREIEFADALPRTATGKLQRFRLRDQEPAQPGPADSG
ncbi:MAG TPA: AMP-binding protein [Candidatus Dormibacteraeota bacterium]|nr:AMP-binding protein [Candidatus Dormibacteraeota bacterium]